MLLTFALVGIMDCSSEVCPRPESYYEVAALSMDSLRTMDGPKKGRIRATKGVCHVWQSSNKGGTFLDRS
jgi:BRCA1-associated RING domain protein 1